MRYAQTMTAYSSSATGLHHKSFGIHVDKAIALKQSGLAETTFQKVHKIRAAGTQIVKAEKSAITSNSFIGQSSQDIRNEMATILTHCCVVTRAEVTKIVKSCMAKIHQKITAHFVETVAKTFDNGLQWSHFGSNEGLK